MIVVILAVIVLPLIASIAFMPGAVTLVLLFMVWNSAAPALCIVVLLVIVCTTAFVIAFNVLVTTAVLTCRLLTRARSLVLRVTPSTNPLLRKSLPLIKLPALMVVLLTTVLAVTCVLA